MTSPRRSGKGGNRTASVLLFALAILLGLFAVARRLWVSVRLGGIPNSWDIPLLEWMVSHRSPAATAAAWFFTIAGDTLGMSTIALCIVALLSWRARSVWPIALVALTAAGSICLTIVLKNALGRARPPLEDALVPVPASYAFPSGHTLNATAILAVAGYLAFLVLRTRLARILVLCALGCFVAGVGWSRIYLGHHWLGDVLGGLLVGGCWATVVIMMHHFVVLRNSRRIRWLQL